MVTGVETAGLILGSLPLIISALEHYAEGVGTIEKWWRYKRELASLKRVLGAEYDRFLNTLEELLVGLVPDTALADMLKMPGGPGWADAELSRKLQNRLRNSYRSYVETINDFNEVVTDLKSKLELDPDGKVCQRTSPWSVAHASPQPRWTDSRTYKREYKRIKFSLSKSAYEDLMRRVDKDNGILANLTHQSLRLEPVRQRRMTRGVAEFDRIRSQAESLYRGLKKNLCCTCQTPHHANLRLEARTSPNREGDVGKLRFRMIFSYDGFNTSESQAWKLREADIEALEIIEQPKPLRKEQPSPTPLPKAKKGLALTLAASVLQLRQTPWLDERWSTSDILFISGTKSPYISRTFKVLDPETKDESIKHFSVIQNETIFSLGVSLIELCFGSSLEALREEEDVSLNPQLTAYMTARRLLSQVYEESGNRYGDAVRRCVNCEFDHRKPSLEVETFRDKFFSGVVVPLEEDWTDFSSTIGGRSYDNLV
ncbi:hypothetical protein GLAREA_05486 [Glarea lozoyensis ATCC 20868]|uniref:DUF7580 domain-containing protein n=1 Tax=Glarea lozoyensis (strain ATCC 20868 / MF5171) TaxID=1116229 RepID=S3ECX8_GLAL2|nr:uncharacterized protein GLAREA_05486 [Glarea lozoyensis ATCC 20868]EPE36148.1 hypothetical protein GLAREA_05486 [Glarea lozoyensis ATCC 20868]